MEPRKALVSGWSVAKTTTTPSQGLLHSGKLKKRSSIGPSRTIKIVAIVNLGRVASKAGSPSIPTPEGGGLTAIFGKVMVRL